MKTAFALIVICAPAMCCASTADGGAAATPAPAPPSGRAIIKSGVRPLTVGPTDSMGAPRGVRGKLAVIANPPKGIQGATIDMHADGKLIGIAEQRPYIVEFDTTTVPDGEHVFKALAKDAEGKQIWAANTRVIVRNSGQVGNAPGAVTAPEPGPGITAPPSPVPDKMPPAPSKPVPTRAAPGTGLDQIYASEKYGFTIRYPALWTFKDDTAHMKPKLPGGLWLVFGDAPIDKSPVVVNVRRSRLEPTTDADVFAKYNSYVLKWQRKTVLGSPAFVTTTGTAESKRVIHRIILIKDHSAWMLNCIDTTGEPADRSRSLFESMVNTLTPKTAPSEARPAGSSSPVKG